MSDDKAKTLSTIFTKVLEDTKSFEGKPRFALFSSPPAGALGEGIDQFRKKPNKGADGKIITKPKQIYGGAPRSGVLSTSYFSKPIYVSVGDKYMDPDRIERQYQMKRRKKFPHAQDFIPASGEKSDSVKSTFNYLPQDPLRKTVVHKGPDGKVPIGPKPFLTSRPKSGHYGTTVGHLFSRQARFMADPYSAQREKEFKEWVENKKKFQKTPFLSTAHGDRPFSADKEIFDIKPNILKKKQNRASTSAGKKKEPFYPSRPPRMGFNGTIGAFPKYMECPPKEIKRKKEGDAPKKEVFRPNSAFLSRPTPSISLNKQNIKYEAAHLMMNTTY